MKALENYVKGGKFFKSVVEDGSDIIFIVDFTGKIHYHNPSVREVLGYKKNSLTGKNFFNFILEETIPELKKCFKISTQKKYASAVEFQFLCRDKTYKYLEFNSINLKFNEGIPGLILDCRDITQRKKDAKELVRAQKAKELFLANISHEIRTPINGIAGMATLLGKNPSADDQITYLNAIKSATDNLKVIINDILDLASIESGKLKFENIGFSLENLLASLEDIFTVQASEKGISLKVQLAKSSQKILVGDPVRLNQIFINLISNAIKFTHSGFIKITVATAKLSAGKANLKFTIEDTGIGIPIEKQSTIFESFSQADASVTRKYGGTGLGLTIVKQLVELQKGTITLDSMENMGSKFIVTIPYEVGTTKNLIDNASPTKKEKPNSLEGINILLVEDNDINRLYASSILKTWDCLFETAENGYVALQKLKKHTFDIILMDIQMPIMDGFEATKAIRMGNTGISKIPIIALTANATKKSTEKCISAGMDDCIVKPFTPEDLLAVLEKHVKTKIQKSAPKKIKMKVREVPDLTYLKGVAKGDSHFVKDIIETILKSLPQTISEIKDLVAQNGDRILLANTIHKIKPSLTMLGLTNLKNQAMDIELSLTENKIENNTGDKILELCQDLSDSLGTLK